MFNQLKTLMPSADFFYGPLTRDQVFSLPFQAFATQVGDAWYIGTTAAAKAFKDKEVKAPSSTPTA